MCVCILSCCIYVEFSIFFFSHELPEAIFFLSNSHAPDGPFRLLLPSIIRSSISISTGTSGKELKRKGDTVLKLLVDKGSRGLSSIGDNYCALVHIVNFTQRRLQLCGLVQNKYE